MGVLVAAKVLLMKNKASLIYHISVDIVGA